MQQENMRPQRNIEINDKIADEKYQNNKTYDKKSDDRDQMRTINKKNKSKKKKLCNCKI